MRGRADTGGTSAAGDAGAAAISADRVPDAADSGPGPCARRNGHDAHPETPEEPERQALAQGIVQASARHAEDPHRSPEAEEEADVPEPQPAPQGGCHWILDERGDPGFPTWCGEEQSPGRPYCPDHCRRVYRRSGGQKYSVGHFHQPPPKRRRGSRHE